jgi:hypothetical protein
MKTVGTKNQHKNENQIPKGYQEGENRKKNIERKINNKMNKYENMVIPAEADGIVDDQNAFEEQQKINEAQLQQEIDSAKQDSDELYINDYEDIEFIPNKESNSEKELKIAKRKQILGHAGINIFAKRARIKAIMH